jgi:hypothetical protein
MSLKGPCFALFQSKKNPGDLGRGFLYLPELILYLLAAFFLAGAFFFAAFFAGFFFVGIKKPPVKVMRKLMVYNKSIH